MPQDTNEEFETGEPVRRTTRDAEVLMRHQGRSLDENGHATVLQSEVYMSLHKCTC